MRTNDFQKLLNDATESGRIVYGKQLINHLLLMENGLSRLIQIIVRNASEEDMVLITEQIKHARDRINNGSNTNNN